jgi:nucleoside-diphosphate-sugar epimerase
MANLYALLLELPDSKIAGKTYNAGYENFTINELAEKVREVVSLEMPDRREITIETVPSNDTRSYHICSEKIKRELGFRPRFSVEDAVRDLVHAFQAGKIPNPLDDVRYHNIKSMQKAQLN